MGFTLPVVRECPVAKTTVGRLRVPHWILAGWGRALRQETGMEWATIHPGIVVDEAGVDIRVTDQIVPPQKRHASEVTIFEFDRIPGQPEIVLACHSHHSMGAFFSGTDEDNINRRFRTSIVLSTQLEGKGEMARWFGFSYQAVGRVKGPCGTLLVVPFILEPDPLPEGWPALTAAQWGLPTPEQLAQLAGKPLNDCNQKKLVAIDALYDRTEVLCGIPQADRVARYAAFGVGDDNISPNLPKGEPRVYTYPASGGGSYNPNGGGYGNPRPVSEISRTVVDGSGTTKGDEYRNPLIPNRYLHPAGAAMDKDRAGRLSGGGYTQATDDDWENLKEREKDYFNRKDQANWSLCHTLAAREELLREWMREYYIELEYRDHARLLRKPESDEQTVQALYDHLDMLDRRDGYE